MSCDKTVIDSLIAARLPEQVRLRNLCQRAQLRITPQSGGAASASYLAVLSENAAAAHSAVHDHKFLDQLLQFTSAHLLAEAFRD